MDHGSEAEISRNHSKASCIEGNNQISVFEILRNSIAIHRDRIAVFTKDRQYSYADLDRRSLQIAALLKRNAAQLGDVIGVLQERGFDFIATVLGIIRSGCTYLPLDPAYPAERLVFMASDANARFVLSSQTCETVAANFQVSVVLIDSPQPQESDSQNHVVENLVDDIRRDHAVYIIYTSGTTGKPKGVPIFSTALANFICSQAEYLGVHQNSRLFQNSSICFDMSVWEIFLTLSTGASIAIADNATLQDGRRFVQALNDLKVSHILLTPSMLSVMPYQELKSLECIVSAGEKCPQSMIDCWAPGRQFYDAYGATEATVYTTITRCVAHQAKRDVGRPMANTAVHILDSQLNPLPKGEVGEIYISGIGVSTGYINREELSRQRFLSSPYGRLYKTGDLGCMTANGALRYKGRIDNQVKINGYRIELEEIEAAANSNPRVFACHATVLTIGDSGKQQNSLILYVVYGDQARLTARELKRYLSRQLPHYMIPSLIVELDSLPLTGSGKINVKALPIPETRNVSMLRSQDQLQILMEYKLSQMWAGLLGHHSFTLQDSFFDVGGHSLLANQLFALIEKELGLDIPVSTIFEYDTIVDLSNFLRGKQDHHNFNPLVKLQTGDPQKRLYCVHPGGGSLFCYHDLIRELGSDWTVLGIQSENSNFATPVNYRTVEEMAASYVANILDHDAPESISLLGWSSGGLIAYEMAGLLSERGVEVNYVGMIDSYLSGDYVEGIELDKKAHFVYRVIHGRLIDPIPEAIQEKIAEMSEAEAIAYIFEQAKDNDVIPSSVTLDRILRSVEIHRENCLASKAYQPKSISVPVTLYRGMKNNDAQTNRLMGWDRVLPEDFRACTVDADHYSIIASKHIGAVTRDLLEYDRQF